MKIFDLTIASDDAGIHLKAKIIKFLQKNKKVLDLGTNNDESVDYPDYAHKMVKKH